ncbi:MAG TPA: Hpt domain-containing protein [Telmatospirillum sp.]|nr:Hpt domain-containing protein [Telmatospirillum sp.]
MAAWDKQAILDLAPMTDVFGAIDEDAKAALEVFLTSTRPLLASIQMKLFAGDLSGAADAAHSAKGAANVSGAFRLGGLCAEVCAQLQEGHLAQAQSLLALLPDAFNDVQAAIKWLAIDRPLS